MDEKEMTYREKWLQIITHFGVRAQTKKLSEEAYELEEALNDAKGYPVLPEMKEHIAEEIADVAVLINQFIEYFNLDGHLIDDMIFDKTDRTLARIESGYYDKK